MNIAQHSTYSASNEEMALAHGAQRDHVFIRGRRLVLRDVINRDLLNEANISKLSASLLNASPFQHLVIDGLFNPVLLELVHEEFDVYAFAKLSEFENKREKTFRSQSVSFGPATDLYFGIVNAPWFVESLSKIVGVKGLAADSSLYGGGLHESRQGGAFAIHRDFDRHPRTGLHNEMVLLTYLNKNWQSAWGGNLELWDSAASVCAKVVEPLFGRTLILRHGPNSYHGHPLPMQLPADRTRRSVGSYYYSSRLGDADQWHQNTSFLMNDRMDRIKLIAKGLTPPLLWRTMKRFADRG